MPLSNSLTHRYHIISYHFTNKSDLVLMSLLNSLFQEPIYIVTELMTHGCLLDYLHEGEGRNLREQELIDITAQVKQTWFIHQQ